MNKVNSTNPEPLLERPFFLSVLNIVILTYSGALTLITLILSINYKWVTEVLNDYLPNQNFEEFRVLITTTLLERGITFPDIDCIVLRAEHDVFNKSTLIQIAGRVGRAIGFENGSVIFYSKYLSKAMRQAKKEIQLMNKQNEMQNM